MLDYASFLIRLWRAPADEGALGEEPVWMGEVESIQTGHTWRFENVEGLSALLVSLLADPTNPVD